MKSENQPLRKEIFFPIFRNLFSLQDLQVNQPVKIFINFGGVGPGGEDVQKSRGSICGFFGTTPGGLAMGKRELQTHPGHHSRGDPPAFSEPRRVVVASEIWDLKSQVGGWCLSGSD